MSFASVDKAFVASAEMTPKQITFGEFFQPASEEPTGPIKGEHKKLLFAYKRHTVKKLKGFINLGDVIIAAKEKPEESLKMVHEIARLRAHLLELKIARDCEKATVEISEDPLESKLIHGGYLVLTLHGLYTKWQFLVSTH
ncbi:uncharacterized protein DFL_003222 [Arthrobotrys flagrans]|uniref:Uncharacterized protein n=1 Tax=Arthrobotrys flagrans TaxID=97331 RepID=A0A437A1A6_ARTFL|nr:hypothetical protein DFL_003222 [Arthrobotrys flagrans]